MATKGAAAFAGGLVAFGAFVIAWVTYFVRVRYRRTDGH
jgi:hypothetical protein